MRCGEAEMGRGGELIRSKVVMPLLCHACLENLARTTSKAILMSNIDIILYYNFNTTTTAAGITTIQKMFSCY